MGLSWWHILLVLLVFVLLFGTGKISGLMGDLAKGIKSFKKESIARQHFHSAVFLEYQKSLASLCGIKPGFSRLHQQQTFESIY